MPKALITGITGNNARFLVETLLENDYEVCGVFRATSMHPHLHKSRLMGIEDKIQLESADVLDFPSMLKIIRGFSPDEIYHLAAQTHVGESFNLAVSTLRTIHEGTMNLLGILKEISPRTKFFNPASAEMFGNSVDPDGFQRETTPMNPISPYGIAKLTAYNLTHSFRKAYGMHIYNGILFNTESPLRSTDFVTGKIVERAVKIKRGLENQIEMGNLDSFRDWGHAKDSMRAAFMIMQQKEPDDFVIATGESHSVREMMEYVFRKLDLDYTKYVVQSEKLLRPLELDRLRGDSTKLKEKTGWKPTYTFEETINEIIDYWMKETPALQIGRENGIYVRGSKEIPRGNRKRSLDVECELILEPEKLIPLSELEIVFVEGEKFKILSDEGNLCEESEEFWKRRDSEVTKKRLIEVENAFMGGDTGKLAYLEKHIGGSRLKSRISRAFLNGKKLYLGTSPVSFADFIKTNERGISDKNFRRSLIDMGLEDDANPDRYFASPLSVCAVLYGLDEQKSPYVVIGHRSDKVMHFPERYHVFGTFVDSQTNPTASIEKALYEKLGLKRNVFGNPVFYGMVRQIPSRIPEMVLGIPIKISPKELKNIWKRAPASFEHDDIQAYNIDDLSEFLSKRRDQMVPSSTENAINYFLKNYA
ncbi:GDP-mannose 4,6-dehydratase [Candidatus Pacearchaeota archaeon]|nr:GDP-mannose 4,6-dehydratase [Candidatus Pacearchaeota archaeon]